jgi:hypothetical protein
MARRFMRPARSKAELAALWDTALTTGTDFFSDLEPIGFAGGSLKGNDKRFLAAAREAWRLYGPAIMAYWRDYPRLPVAFERFGEP